MEIIHPEQAEALPKTERYLECLRNIVMELDIRDICVYVCAVKEDARTYNNKTTMELVFAEKNLTHMPFLTTFGGTGQYLFFCSADGPITVKRNHEDEFPSEDPNYYMESYVPWKMHWYDLNPSSTPTRIETGFPDDSIECSPAVYFDNGLFHLTFVGGQWDSQHMYLSYNLYKMTGPDINSFGPPKIISKMKSRTGFYNKNYLAFDDIQNSLKIKDARTGEKYMISVPFTKTNRLTYMAQDHSKLIASGDLNGVDRSYLIDLDDITFKEILSSTVGPVYKCTLYDDIMMFAVKSEQPGATYEDRKVYKDNFVLADTTEEFHVYYKDWPESKSETPEATAAIRRQAMLLKTWKKLAAY